MPDDNDDFVRRFPMANVRAQEFYALARRLKAERASAPSLIEHALRQTARHAWPSLAEREGLATCGVIEHLGQMVGRELTRDPKYAEALAALAVTLSEALPPVYPTITLSQIRALAWKNRGKVLSTLARHDEAIEAFAEAERQIDGFSTLEHDRAVIRLNLAIAYVETARLSEASDILVECKRVFLDHGDANLYVVSGFCEGLTLQRMNRHREARETYLLLMTSTNEMSKATLAALHQSIGLCSTEIGDFGAAEQHLRKAIALHTDLGQTLDAVKGEHGRGMLFIHQGLLEQGITHLRSVRHQYLKASLAEEAGLCGLEMVSALLGLGKPETAEALARTILNEFLAASLNTRAITALGYLSEAIAEQKASPSLASDVREYVLSLRTTPEREFLEPPLPPRAGE